MKTENKRVDADKGIFAKEIKEYKKSKRIKFFAAIKTKFNKLKPNNKNKSKGLLAKHADELASAMKTVKTRSEMYALAKLMRDQAEDIRNTARKM
jgi:hypothetical protein